MHDCAHLARYDFLLVFRSDHINQGRTVIDSRVSRSIMPNKNDEKKAAGYLQIYFRYDKRLKIVIWSTEVFGFNGSLRAVECEIQRGGEAVDLPVCECADGRADPDTSIVRDVTLRLPPSLMSASNANYSHHNTDNLRTPSSSKNC